MKRSRHLALLLMGATPFLLGGCDDAGTDSGDAAATEEVSEAAYADRAECVADQNSASDCEKAFVAAEGDHAKEHPRFATREDCEKEFSAADCTEMVNGEERHWAPHSHGILFRRPLSGYGYSGGDAAPVESHPLYRSHTGALVATAAAAGAVGVAAGAYAHHATTPVTATAHAHTVTRGGFGHTAAAHSSGSHSSSSHSSSHSSGGHSSGG